MPSRHLSVRLDEGTFAHLDAAVRRAGTSRSQLVKRLVEEGLRMEEHPGIVFRPSLEGSEPALVDGPYLWKIMPLLRDLNTGATEDLERAAGLTNLTVRQVRAALGYYDEYSDELEDRIRRNEDEAERAHRAWQRQQPVAAR